MMRRWGKQAGWRRLIKCVVAGGLLLGVWLPVGHWVTGRWVPHPGHVVPVPTVMIPGSGADQDRFDALIQALSHDTAVSVLKLRVTPGGQIRATGQLIAGRWAVIVVAFVDNRDGEATIRKQAGWLQRAMQWLVRRQRVTQVNAVGHSNGGLVWTLYLEQAAPAAVTVTRLITLGSPYNGDHSSVTKPTPLLTVMRAQQTRLPATLRVDSVAGTQTLTGDGTVPLGSVEAGRYVFQGHVAQFTQTTVSGQDASHSDLLANPQVLALLRHRLMVAGPPDRGHD
ncbi:alpha/beta hydrolase [Lacticaseibacillus absianus]|uniref:alpha/beta hydrolase n=1 Tax=Lacticaseibacillus absianus TaxID=2729623 RepID=UPI0015C9088F|nr:alpha/beta hydrolase [Lacticaseibacillus absianus]